MIHSRLLVLAAGLVGTLTQSIPGQQQAGIAGQLDSLVLERTVCFGTCPAYRLIITRTGRLTFRGTHPKDTTKASTSLPRDSLAALLWALDHTSLATLPDTIASDPTLCPDHATDHPSVILTLYLVRGARRIEDYHGCYLRPDHTMAKRLAGLRALEETIDRVAQTSRWVRHLVNRYEGPPN